LTSSNLFSLSPIEAQREAQLAAPTSVPLMAAVLADDETTKAS